MYKRLFPILQYGNSLVKNGFGKPPTFVFPIEIREEVRSRVSNTAAVSREDAFKGNDDTYSVTWEQLCEAK
jgi:hypothetical protein